MVRKKLNLYYTLFFGLVCPFWIFANEAPVITQIGSTILDFKFDTYNRIYPQNWRFTTQKTFGSELYSSTDGAIVNNGGTPDISLTWSHNNLFKFNGLISGGFSPWSSMDPAYGKGAVLQLDMRYKGNIGAPHVTFSTDNNTILHLDSLMIGHSSFMDVGDSNAWTFTILDEELIEVFNYTTSSIKRHENELVTFNFTGEVGADYILKFDDNGSEHDFGGIKNLKFSQIHTGQNPVPIVLNENQTSVVNVVATDVDSDTLTYSISGGADEAKFSINPSSGMLTFLSPPDFENPTDIGDTAGNNTYVVNITVTDNGLDELTDTQTFLVTVKNINEAPVITSGGELTTLSYIIQENILEISTIKATDEYEDALRYSITGGLDASKFNINPTSGLLKFNSAPNFENPTDTNGDNSYAVIIRASDHDGLYAEKNLIVSISDYSQEDSDNDGLLEETEDTLGLSDLNSDTDGDTLLDLWEVTHDLDPKTDDANLDPDNDELDNLGEFQNNSDPNDPDTDDDGLTDGWEVEKTKTNPSISDSDGNSVIDYMEDTDGDGLPDGWELTHGFDHDSPRGTIVHSVTALKDSYQIDGLENPDLTFFLGNIYRFELDGSTMSNKNFYLSSTDHYDDGQYIGEVFLGTRINSISKFEFEVSDAHPEKLWYREGYSANHSGNISVKLADPDGDPDEDDLINLLEFQFNTNPHKSDTDSDGVPDGEEVHFFGSDPTMRDTDKDGLGDRQEIKQWRTNVNIQDTDNDGISDGMEVARGGDPNEMKEMRFVLVSDSKNPDDDNIPGYNNTGLGYVGESFEMGQYEVTNEQYAKFLNSIAQEDGYHGLYNTKMGTNPNGGITRHGFNSSYTYRVIKGKEKWPVNFVSLWDALRFINWIHNESPTGSQNLQTTESGAYTLLGARPQRVIRNFSARYFLPNMDEWHKAAYYESFPLNRPSQSYWPTATKKAGIRMGISEAGTANGSSATLVNIGWYYYPSPWGTFNQAGNVAEWTETITLDDSRIVKGGSFMSGNLEATTGNPIDPNMEFENIGFRIGRVVEQDKSKTPTLRIDAVLIDNPGNLDDDTIAINNAGIGSVAETFAMGRTEITNSQYTIFLNAVAQTDSFHRLYNTQMQDDINGGIIRSGSNQNDFQYSLKVGMENKSVNFVNIFDAMRFCNWLHNGAHNGSDTESGAYRLHREMDENNLKKTRRNPSARVFIPTEDEWHKAAFFEADPADKPSQSYWNFATNTDTLSPESAVWKASGPQSVGIGSPSSFFTFNQSGNVAEWTESIPSYEDSSRVTRGGSWKSINENELSKTNRKLTPLLTETDSLGFRIAFAYNPLFESPIFRITGNEKPEDISPPVISLYGGNFIELEYGTPYVEPGFDAIDSEEGNLKANVQVSGLVNVFKDGTYLINYNVHDSAGNKAREITRTIKVNLASVPKSDDITPPLITLLGESSVLLEKGDVWLDPGAIAIDEGDGSLTQRISSTGSVDVETTGIYYVRYNVQDFSGNGANEIIRTVRVLEQKEGSNLVQHSMLEIGSDLVYGWRGLGWLGLYYPTQKNWIYHLSHGWLYPKKDGTENYWFYDTELGWFWTGPSHYNEELSWQAEYIYSATHSEWLYYVVQGNRRKFYLYSLSKWIHADGTTFTD